MVVEIYRNIQVLNGKIGSFILDDYTTEFHPFTKDTIKDLISDLKIEIANYDNTLIGDIIITESLATYIIDNVDPTFFDNLSCFNIVEDIDITSARIEDEIPYFRVHIKMETYEFRPKPTKLEVNWSQLANVDIDKVFGKSAQDLLVEAAKEEIHKAAGIPPSYLS